MDDLWQEYEPRPPQIEAVQVTPENIHRLAERLAESNLTPSVSYGGPNPYAPKLLLEGHPEGLLEVTCGEYLVNTVGGGLKKMTEQEVYRELRPSTAVAIKQALDNYERPMITLANIPQGPPPQGPQSE
jgi:hypothetical protein